MGRERAGLSSRRVFVLVVLDDLNPFVELIIDEHIVPGFAFIDGKSNEINRLFTGAVFINAADRISDQQIVFGDKIPAILCNC